MRRIRFWKTVMVKKKERKKRKRKRNVGGHARVIKTLRDPRRGDQSYYKSGKSEERCNPEDLVASETLTVSVGRVTMMIRGFVVYVCVCVKERECSFSLRRCSRKRFVN